MEDVAEALKIGFAVMVFVIALSVVFSMVSQAKQTADIVFEIEDDEKYLADGLEGVTYLTSGDTERIVGWETVVPTIYRYFKEEYGVTIINKNKEIAARFDIETETVVQNWYNSSYNTTMENHIKYLNNKVFYKDYTLDEWEDIFEKIYNAQSRTVNNNKIGAPWLSSNIQDTLNRLEKDLMNTTSDLTVEYTSATYTGLGLAKKYSNSRFKESINIIEETQANGEVKQKVEIIYYEQ